MFLFSTLWACSLICAYSFPRQGFTTRRRLNVTHGSMYPRRRGLVPLFTRVCGRGFLRSWRGAPERRIISLVGQNAVTTLDSFTIMDEGIAPWAEEGLT